jgi:hypothetical protein
MASKIKSKQGKGEGWATILKAEEMESSLTENVTPDKEQNGRPLDLEDRCSKRKNKQVQRACSGSVPKGAFLLKLNGPQGEIGLR